MAFNFERLAIRGLIFFLVLSHLALIEGRGRGGGSGGRGRISVGTRRRVTPIRSVKPRYSRPWFQKPIFVGALFGLAAYKTRRRFRSHPDSEPSICKNFRAPNGTHYGYFICPQWHQKEDFSYCCGPQRGQHCCRFADDPGRLAGMIIGIIISVVFVALLIALCCWYRKRGTKKQGGAGRVLKVTTGNSMPMTSYQPVKTNTGVGYTPGTGATYGVPAEPGQTMYPAQPGQTPYPTGPGETPYPGGQSPYPPNVDNENSKAGFSPGTGTNYGQPDSDAPPYPAEPGGQVYPTPVYPPAATGEPVYPPPSGEPVYPPPSGEPLYPPAYPADGAMYPPADPAPGYPNAPPPDGYQPPASGTPYPVNSAPYPTK